MQQRNDEQEQKTRYVIFCEDYISSDDLKCAEQLAIDLARAHPGKKILVAQFISAFATQPARVERIPLAEVLA